MITKNRKKKVVFSKLFNSGFDQGDFVEFPYGKTIWRVAYINKRANTLRLDSLASYYNRWFHGPNLPFFKAPKEDAIRFTCLNNPSEICRYFDPGDLAKFFKKNLKEV